MKKRIWISLLVACLLAALLPAAALAATASNVSYYGWSDSEKQLVPGTCSTATVVSSSDNTWGDDGNDGWYVVNSNVTIDSRITVTGEVHLILMDGCTLKANAGVQVADNDDNYKNGSPNALTIYGQKAGTGWLRANLNMTSSSEYHAAIGGNGAYEKDPERGGTITINGGNIYAYNQYGAGIGGGAGGDRMHAFSSYGRGGGNVTINGGTISASSWYGAGIGGGSSNKYNSGGGYFVSTSNGDGGSVTIRGGTVTVQSNASAAIGSGRNGHTKGTFETTSDGNAVIITVGGSIQDQSKKNQWHGVIIQGDTGEVYGGTVTPVEDFTIYSNRTLLIPTGMSLNASQVNVTNKGKIYVDGTFTGTADNLYYPLALVKATAPNDIYSVYNSKNYVKVGTAGIALTYDVPAEGYAFEGWDVSPKGAVSIAADNTFTMPQAALTLTARYRDSIAPVISGIENGKIYCTPQTVTVTDNDTIKSVTVNGEPVTLGSDGTFTLTVKDVDQVIVATDKTGNRVEVTAKSGHSGLGHEPARDATVTDTGNIEYWYCTGCQKYFSDADGKNAIEQKDTVVGKLPPEIIAGMGQSVLVGEKKALSFTSNAAYSDFIRVEIEGAGLDSSLYTVREGSTIVTLDADFVAALSAGEYTIGIVSESGTAETTFAVTVQLPQTGDSSRIALWLMLLLLSGGALAGVRCKKRSA